MNRENENLRMALRGLAEETAQQQASPAVRRALLKEVRSRSRRGQWVRFWPVAALAGLVLVVWIGWRRPVEPAPRVVERVIVPEPAPAVIAAPVVTETGTMVRRASVSRTPGDSPLTPWFFYDGYPLAGRGQIIRIEVSRETAAQFGFFTPAQSAKAQVFLGDDGLPRAIRFVR